MLKARRQQRKGKIYIYIYSIVKMSVGGRCHIGPLRLKIKNQDGNGES
jgi:hypothetical protein